MVAVFESDALRREAQAYEDLVSRPGLVGRCVCLLGTIVMGVGFFAVADVVGLSISVPSITQLVDSSYFLLNNFAAKAPSRPEAVHDVRSSRKGTVDTENDLSDGLSKLKAVHDVSSSRQATIDTNNEVFDGLSKPRADVAYGSYVSEPYGSSVSEFESTSTIGSPGGDAAFKDYTMNYDSVYDVGASDRLSYADFSQYDWDDIAKKNEAARSYHMGMDRSLVAICIIIGLIFILPSLLCNNGDASYLDAQKFRNGVNSSGGYPMPGQPRLFGWLFGNTAQGSWAPMRRIRQADRCICGNVYAPGAVICRMCGTKRPEANSLYSQAPWSDSNAMKGSSLFGRTGLDSRLTAAPSNFTGTGFGMYDQANLACQRPYRTASFFNQFLSWLGFGWLFGTFPFESEVAETYRYVVELPRWSAALATFFSQQLIDPLVRELEASDARLVQGFQEMGWQLSFDERSRYSSAFAALPQVSIFDESLPPPFCNNPAALTAWNQRQQLEKYLHHPSFGRAAQRQHVLCRIREWRNRGGMPNDTASASSLQRGGVPSDAHIIENLVFRMLQDSFSEFVSCFVVSYGSPAPPCQHLGQAPQAWLQQAGNPNGLFSKRPPHYDLATPMKLWRLRPGSTNVLEALALLLKILQQANSQSYHSFPAGLRAALENCSYM